MSEILNLEARIELLPEVLGMMEKFLNEAECPENDMMMISICVEEMFVNIANYAYGDSVGMAEVVFGSPDDFSISMPEGMTGGITVSLRDSGIPFDPLKKENPDVTLSAEERNIGGLGIFMVKQSMDICEYSRDKEMNCFKMTKFW